jgi:hypothetical protein
LSSHVLGENKLVGCGFTGLSGPLIGVSEKPEQVALLRPFTSENHWIVSQNSSCIFSGELIIITTILKPMREGLGT